MKIHGQGLVNGTQLISSYKKAEKTLTKSESRLDSIELSDEAKEISKLQRLAAGLPEVRENLVLELKEKISTNNYHIPANKLADKICDEIVKMRK